MLRAEGAEALEPALLLVLEQLSPAERAAYVLRAFGYACPDIARMLRLGVVTVGKIVSLTRGLLTDEHRPQRVRGEAGSRSAVCRG
ncbi:hypothetical protein [Streptomyces sp. NPDC088812]|uniref:hypothetical protein n=1 Tax=Streptomyces sp. NPDC088812 TaxID=3365905 RepID=UPI00381BF55A